VNRGRAVAARVAPSHADIGRRLRREPDRETVPMNVEYARFTDDLAVLIDAYKRHDWLIGAVTKRLREEFTK
jgi:hypothetical protein